jgi:2'-5' RNA ligase
LLEKKIRSFLAVEVDDEAISMQILNLQKTLLETNANLSLVAAKNTHITLKYFGEIPLRTVKMICNELQKIRFNPFQIRLKGVGVYPSLRRINVVWIGMDQGIIELTDLLNQIKPGLTKLGFPPAHRGFTPHVTIARVRSSRHRDQLAKVVSLMNDVDIGSFNADSVKLKRSVLTKKGPIYSTLCEIRG